MKKKSLNKKRVEAEAKEEISKKQSLFIMPHNYESGIQWMGKKTNNYTFEAIIMKRVLAIRGISNIP